MIIFKDLKFKSKLHFVRIFFDTSTFDKVTKGSIKMKSWNFAALNQIQDEKAKSVDKLSAIGGTFGLLTGFSIISAVEVLFFMLKMVWSFIQEKLVDWKTKL